MIIDVNNLADQTLDGEHVKSEGSLQAVWPWMFFYKKATTLYLGCQIFLGTTDQNGKNIPNWLKILPDGHKIYKMA
jgi:hypothetical protein